MDRSVVVPHVAHGYAGPGFVSMSPDRRRRRGRRVGESNLPLGEKTVFVSSGGDSVGVGVWGVVGWPSWPGGTLAAPSPGFQVPLLRSVDPPASEVLFSGGEKGLVGAFRRPRRGEDVQRYRAPVGADGAPDDQIWVRCSYRHIGPPAPPPPLLKFRPPPGNCLKTFFRRFGTKKNVGKILKYLFT